MSKKFEEKVLIGLPLFNENDFKELKIKVDSQTCCFTHNEEGKLIRNEAKLHYIEGPIGEILGYLGQCPICKKSYYYEGK